MAKSKKGYPKVIWEAKAEEDDTIVKFRVIAETSNDATLEASQHFDAMGQEIWQEVGMDTLYYLTLLLEKYFLQQHKNERKK